MLNARAWFSIHVKCERKMPFNADKHTHKHTQSTENCNGKYFIESNIPYCCRFPMVSVFRIRMELGTKLKIHIIIMSHESSRWDTVFVNYNNNNNFVNWRGSFKVRYLF